MASPKTAAAKPRAARQRKPQTTAEVDIETAVLAADFRPIDNLVPYARNARTHSDEQIAQLAALIEEFGWTYPVLADDKGIVAGHGRVMAARKLYEAGRTIRLMPGGEDAPAIPAGTVPVLDCSGWSEAKRRFYILADNQSALNAGYDEEILKLELTELGQFEMDLDLLGFEPDYLEGLLGDESQSGSSGKSGAGSLAAKFGVPPFSVLNAREGWWQDRKAAWIALGIKSELGRGAAPGGSPMPMDRAAPGGSKMPAANYSKRQRGDGAGRAVAKAKGNADDGLAFGEINFESGAPASGTSIFDPVLCELAYRWFSPPSGVVLDPFAGGSVRGIVAARLGREYVGVDLRAEQIAANQSQGDVICAGDSAAPRWIEGDSAAIIPDLDVKADFLFSCPPYGDLEVYSDDAADLSNMAHAAFIEAYRKIIALAVGKLKPNRFACFVVGDFRDDAGMLSATRSAHSKRPGPGCITRRSW